MNRKVHDKETNDRDKDELTSQPIMPKFVPNWTQCVRFDRIVVNVSDCQYEVVPKTAKKLKFKTKNDQTNPEWDLWWTDWHVTPEILMKMEHHQKINHFPGMFVLARKNMLAKNLMRMRKKSPEEYNFFPLTWTLPLEYQQFKTYFQSKPKGKARTYIVKPECMSQGKGIFLTRKLQQINAGQKCVVQRYLSRPYLIDGLKFDLRIYVLVAGVDPLRVYIFRDGLARFATQSYTAPNKQNMEDVRMHLTNYAINKESDKFIFNQDANDMGVGHKRNLEAVFNIMGEKGVDVPALWDKIQDLIVKTLISGYAHLKFQYRSCQPQNYRGDMCFQILGFDVIITDDVEPILLEINYTPSFSTDTPLDYNIKSSLINDTMVLMGINKQFKQTTVKHRKECRDVRMMTGKKNKLTPEEKEEKRKENVKDRDQYAAQHLGGFTQIFPLSAQHPRQEVYNKLLQMEGDLSAQPKKNMKNETPPAIIRRNTQKLGKLPMIYKQPQDIKSSTRKLAASHKHGDYSKTSKMIDDDRLIIQSQEEHKSQPGRQFSQKAIKRLRVRDIPQNTKKKPLQVRQTLVPKTIQFEGTCFNGIREAYHFEVSRGGRQ